MGTHHMAGSGMPGIWHVAYGAIANTQRLMRNLLSKRAERL